MYGGVNQSSTNYTYEVIQVVPDTNGTYTFVSTSGSNLKFYGYLYNGSFIPSSPLTNLIARSDSLTGTLQFNLTSTLVEDTEYLLVVTTSNQTATGPFNITASGPGLIAFTRRSVPASSGKRLFNLYLASRLMTTIVCGLSRGREDKFADQIQLFH